MRLFIFCFLLLPSLAQALAQAGLYGEYFTGRNFNRKVFSRVDAKLDFAWNQKAPGPGMPATDYSIRWTGKILAPATGNYIFSAVVDDGIRVKVGGVQVMDAWGPHDHESVTGEVALEKGKTYDLQVDYFNGILEGEIRLQWEIQDPNGGFFDRLQSKPETIPASAFLLPAPPSTRPIPKARPADALPASETVVKPLEPVKPNLEVNTDPIRSPYPKVVVVQKTKGLSPKVANSLPKAPARVSLPQRIGQTQTASAKQPEKQTSANPKVPLKPKVLYAPARVSRDSVERYLPKNVLFELGESVLLEESLPDLKSFANYLKRNPRIRVRIEGHTDLYGDPSVNLDLSEDRAIEVANYLESQGVQGKRLLTRGFGSTRPLTRKSDQTLVPQNRRVEFILEEIRVK